MTATLHKITAGDGYEYYTRHVAAHDADERGGLGLSDYYAARGESPGRWMGSGLAGLKVQVRGREVPVSVIAEGEEVTAEQMEYLFGFGMHPQANSIQSYVIAQQLALGATQRQALNAAEQAAALGQRFRVYEPSVFRTRCAQAFTDFNRARGLPGRAPIGDADRARIRTAVAEEMFGHEFGREPLNDRELSAWVARHNRQTTTAVAGFDWTFSPVKSVSVVWALAPRPIAEKVEAAHRAAVADALSFLETEATFTRMGRNGVEQVEVEGLIAAAFEHRDSRAGDPDLHTHVVVPNKVRTRVDGKWRTIDGAMFYRSAVTASEVYNTRLELHMHRLLGCRFAERVDPAGAGKRAVRELIGVYVTLAQAWSRRHAQVVERLDELTVAFQKTHGREPTPVEMYALDQRATLETRARKQHRSHAEQRRMWSQQAVEVLGSRAAVHRMLAEALTARPGPATVIDQAWTQRCADEVVAEVASKRASWRRWHVRAEAERRIRDHVTVDTWQQVADAVTAAALAPSRSVPRGDPDRHAEPGLRAPPAVFTRSDGTSIFRAADHQIYTSPMVLDLESRLIEMTQLTDGRTLAPEVVEAAIDAHNNDPANTGRQLNEGQVAMVREFATSGRSLQFGNAPAGSGKTSAMRILTRAWHADGGRVLGLAPTARAAAVLQADTGVRVSTVDKLLHVLTEHLPTPQQQVAAGPDDRPPQLPQWVLDIGPDTLVIVDEHMQIADLPRLRMLNYLLSRGATVRLIGDDQQLAAIDASGAAGDMMRTSTPVSLTHVVRFADTAEASASLMLRDGDPAALGFYLDRDRVHVGAPGAVVDAAFTAWLADYHDAGADAIMLAPTHTLVSELNRLARAHRLATTEAPGREVELADELSASAGDVIRTGLNDPRLRVGADDYVRNGYQWLIDTVHPDGAVTATQLLPGRVLGNSVRLPGEYVRASVRLGYAATIDSAQGTTTDTCHVVLTGSESRNQLYVALTRGRHANHLYLTTAVDGSDHSLFTEEAARPRTAVDVLTHILSRDGAAVSAHTELHRARDPFRRLGHAVDVYLDALDLAVHTLHNTDAATRLDAAVEQVLPGLTAKPGYPGLRRHLTYLAVSGRDPVTELRAVIKARELATADDLCAVLRWRLDPTGTDSTPPAPLSWLPGIPRAVAEHPELGPYVAAWARIVTAVTEQIREAAADFTPATAPVWARPLVGADAGLVGEVAVWRAALHIPDKDLHPCGPARHAAPERRHHEILTVRVDEAIGDANLAMNVWSVAAKRVDVRVLEDPYWPVLADRLDIAARAGIDIDARLDTAAAGPPLPDAMPAAALWFRLDLDLDTLDIDTRPRIAPQWAHDLRAVLGADAAEHILREPGWPRLVAALERATTTGAFTARDALATAVDMIEDSRADDSDTLRPRHYVLALAWRIDLLTHHHAELPITTVREAPPELEHTYPDPEDTSFPDDNELLDATQPSPPPTDPAAAAASTPPVAAPDPVVSPATTVAVAGDEPRPVLPAGEPGPAPAPVDDPAEDDPRTPPAAPEVPLADGAAVEPVDRRSYTLAPKLVRPQRADVWAPVEDSAPQVADVLLYLSSHALPDPSHPASRRTLLVHHFQHAITGGHLSLDAHGQPWQITALERGLLRYSPLDLDDALTALQRPEPALHPALADLSDEQRATVRRIKATFARYPRPIARARLNDAATTNAQVYRLLYQPTGRDTPPPIPDTPTADVTGADTAPATDTSDTRERAEESRAAFDAAAMLFAAGAVRTGRAELNNLTDEQRQILRRVETTYRTYPFPIARARLQRAATDNPAAAQLITACIPDQDPGLYSPTPHQPDTSGGGGQPRHEVFRRVDRTRITRTRRNPDDQRAAEAYFTHRRDLSPGDDADARQMRPEEDYPYDGGDLPVELTLPRDLPCVACDLERPLSESASRVNQDGHDDGLCGDCRDQGAPGIPAHPPDRALIARCEHLAATRPEQHLRGLLRRDWRRLPLAQRVTMIRWMRERDLLTPPTQPVPAVDTANPLLVFTDTQLAEAIQQAHNTITMDTTFDALRTANLRHTTDTTTAPTKPNTVALEAITDARRTAAAVTDLQTQIRSLSTQASDVRVGLTKARRRDRPPLEKPLQNLLTALAKARRDADEAHRRATRIAGPPAGWDALTNPPAPAPAPAAAVAPPRPVTPAATTADQRHLEQLRAEQRRRRTLTPDQRQLEDDYRRDHPAQEATPPGIAAQSALEPRPRNREAGHDTGPAL